jgi:hypothetical protein
MREKAASAVEEGGDSSAARLSHSALSLATCMVHASQDMQQKEGAYSQAYLLIDKFSALCAQQLQLL